MGESGSFRHLDQFGCLDADEIGPVSPIACMHRRVELVGGHETRLHRDVALRGTDRVAVGMASKLWPIADLIGTGRAEFVAESGGIIPD